MKITEGSSSYEAAHDRWLIQYRIDGRKMKARGKTLNLALARKSEQVAAAKGEAALTITAALAKFQRSIGRRAPGTLKNYARAVERLTETAGDILIARVRPADVEQVLSDMANAGHKATTLMCWRKAISPLFVWAVRHGHMSANPLDGVKVATFRAAPSAPREPLSIDDARTLTKYLTADLSGAHVAHLLMLWGGLRISEALGLAWMDVDLPGRTIRVRQQVTMDGSGVTRQLKTPSSVRILHDLPAVLMDALAAWRAQVPADAVLVCSATATKRRPLAHPIARRGVQESLRLACERAGVPVVVPHGLRHTAGSVLYNVTGDLTHVADFLGHDDLVLVTSLYVKAVQRVDAGALIDSLMA